MPPKRSQINEENIKNIEIFNQIITKYDIQENNISQLDPLLILKINELFLKNKIENSEDDIYLEYLGLYHKFVTKNEEEMIVSFLMSSQMGNDNAMRYLADYYKEKKNYKDMESYYKNAIENENVNAMVNLGEYYYEKKNYDEMKKYLNMGIEKGNPKAIYLMGDYYMNIEKNDIEARKYLVLAGKKNYKKAFYNLGKILETEKNYTYMKRLYEKGCDLGCENCMISLGYHYQFKEKKFNDMLKYYNMAIERGNAVALNNVGVYYNDTYNYHEAVRYYNMAIERGQINAMNNLALYYKKSGQINLMIKYLKMGVENGNKDSIKELGEYYESIKDYNEMKKVYTIGIKIGMTEYKTKIEIHKNNEI